MLGIKGPKVYHWTFNAGGVVAKEVHYVLVSTNWRILQNCAVSHNAEFITIELFVVFKIHVKTKRI